MTPEQEKVLEAADVFVTHYERAPWPADPIRASAGLLLKEAVRAYRKSLEPPNEWQVVETIDRNNKVYRVDGTITTTGERISVYVMSKEQGVALAAQLNGEKSLEPKPRYWVRFWSDNVWHILDRQHQPPMDAVVAKAFTTELAERIAALLNAEGK